MLLILFNMTRFSQNYLSLCRPHRWSLIRYKITDWRTPLIGRLSQYWPWIGWLAVTGIRGHWRLSPCSAHALSGLSHASWAESRPRGRGQDTRQPAAASPRPETERMLSKTSYNVKICLSIVIINLLVYISSIHLLIFFISSSVDPFFWITLVDLLTLVFICVCLSFS